jgi:RNA polymerase sigma-70 factor, ECF subfamily
MTASIDEPGPGGEPRGPHVPVSDGPRLFAIAYRMLGSTHDAQDAVQETFLRWQRLTPDARAGITNPAAWLTTAIGRICLDHLGSARVRRERYTGIWLPEPVPGRVDPEPAGAVGRGTARGIAADPADVITLEESVSLAMLVVMEQLSPAERVSFILHDLFGIPFAEIAATVGRTEQACRQLASSARRHLHGQRRYAGDGPERDRVVQAFLHACTRGDLTELLAVLAPDVVVRSDGGGQVSAATHPVAGAEVVARFLLGILTNPPAPSWTDRYGTSPPRIELDVVNGQTGVVVHLGDRPALVAALGVADDHILAIDLVVNPDKLAPWTRAHRALPDHTRPGGGPPRAAGPQGPAGAPR